MKDLNKLTKILKNKRLELGFSLRKMEDLLESNGIIYTHTALNKLEQGRNTNIDALVLKKLADIYNLNLEEAFAMAGYKELLIEKEQPNCLLLPMYSFSNSGKGYINFEGEVKKIVLSEFNNKVSKKSFCIEVNSGLMEPFYSNGDILVINPNLCVELELLNKKECVIEYKGERFLKRLLFDEGDLSLKAYNDAYKTIKIPNEKINEVKCLGVVVLILKFKL